MAMFYVGSYLGCEFFVARVRGGLMKLSSVQYSVGTLSITMRKNKKNKNKKKLLDPWHSKFFYKLIILLRNNMALSLFLYKL